MIAATDYMRSYSDQIGRWITAPYVTLGTDGYGRSDTRAQLRHFFEADACLRSSRLLKNIDLFLVDVMLPSEFRYPIDYSRYTGVFLARDIRKYHQAVPIVLLSNHSMPDAVARIQKALASIGNCAFVSKQRFKTALDFGDIIEAILADGVGALKRGFWKRLGAGVLIQPNFAGVGVDLREVFDV